MEESIGRRGPDTSPKDLLLVLETLWQREIVLGLDAPSAEVSHALRQILSSCEKSRSQLHTSYQTRKRRQSNQVPCEDRSASCRVYPLMGLFQCGVAAVVGLSIARVVQMKLWKDTFSCVSPERILLFPTAARRCARRPMLSWCCSTPRRNISVLLTSIFRSQRSDSTT